MYSIYQILMLIIGVVQFFIFAHVIMSWLINFEVLNIHQPIVRDIWSGLNRILAPLYSQIRRFLPAMGGMDFAPLVALLGILVIKIVLTNNVALFL